LQISYIYIAAHSHSRRKFICIKHWHLL
jgi:hypothetical protein